MSYPDDFSQRAYDAAQGRDENDDAEADRRALSPLLAQLQAIADTLRGIDAGDDDLNFRCWNGSDELEKVVAKISGAMP